MIIFVIIHSVKTTLVSRNFSRIFFFTPFFAPFALPRLLRPGAAAPSLRLCITSAFEERCHFGGVCTAVSGSAVSVSIWHNFGAIGFACLALLHNSYILGGKMILNRTPCHCERFIVFSFTLRSYLIIVVCQVSNAVRRLISVKNGILISLARILNTSALIVYFLNVTSHV